MPSIDWRMFSVDVQDRWKRPVDMKTDLGFSQSTLMAAWHGKPIGALPLLQACSAMGANPLRYLSTYDAAPSDGEIYAAASFDSPEQRAAYIAEGRAMIEAAMRGDKP